MPRKSTTAKPEAAFSAESLEELLDIYAVPVAHEAIRRALPDRVHHHIRRLLSSDKPADRAELLALMQGAKMSIAFAVFHAVLQGSRESTENRLEGTEQAILPSTSSSSVEAA